MHPHAWAFITGKGTLYSLRNKIRPYAQDQYPFKSLK